MADDEIRSYDPKMHGMDWDAAKAKHEPPVGDVAGSSELTTSSTMIGELNAAYGAAPAPGAWRRSFD
jgi:hypothetical protein